jgi:hypothetical protein
MIVASFRHYRVWLPDSQGLHFSLPRRPVERGRPPWRLSPGGRPLPGLLDGGQPVDGLGQGPVRVGGPAGP